MVLLPYRPLQTLGWWVKRARQTQQAGCRVPKAPLLALPLKAAPFDPLGPVLLSPTGCVTGVYLPSVRPACTPLALAAGHTARPPTCSALGYTAALVAARPRPHPSPQGAGAALSTRRS